MYWSMLTDDIAEANWLQQCQVTFTSLLICHNTLYPDTEIFHLRIILQSSCCHVTGVFIHHDG